MLELPMPSLADALGLVNLSVAAAAPAARHWAETLVQMPNLVFVFGFAIASVAILTGVIKSIAVTREREQTRREIAAYLSQGMLTNEQAAMLLSKRKSVRSGDGSGC